MENVFNYEELLWRQKARCDWLHFGDRNTNFFHSHTNKRRKFNHIPTLRFGDGDWCSDQDILQAKAVEFFERLYGETPHTSRETEVTNEEIKRALFDIAPLKAPGSDGYHVLFFQS